ncbi:dienelactone hydrolase family protein [Nocardioides stalactiti]|uniref:dienelactone hydrolase family protein n=1 Tax=Nocardioides stalactiti TaxID=2755356 RepID=UPI0016046DFD|nr:dienelactone hydrolase family protein [Nocardioides stalactiti]
MTDLLASWALGEHTADDLDGESLTFPTYRKGSGPGVIVIHEVPGMTPQFIGFAEEVVAAGFTVVLPHLFGTPGKRIGPLYVSKVISRLCVSREFVALATRQTSPVSGWLRSLARDLHADTGGPGVGAIGMCFTGGFALGMMVDDAIAAPVLCQPSVPFAMSPKQSRDLGLSPADLDVVKKRAAGGCEVLGLQYAKDPMTGSRFNTLDRELGDAFLRVDFPGAKHSTVTLHRQQEGVDRVLGFLREKLAG